MIPVNEPVIGEQEKSYVMECLNSGWISSEGPFVSRFEKAFASYIGMSEGIAVANGTAALEVALYAAGVSEGDEVILPSFSIVSLLLAILRLGAKPVLVDIEPETWNLDVTRVSEKVTPKTKAIIVVHTYGHSADLDPLLELSKKFGIALIEDAAEAHGAEYKGKKCGSLGLISSFSFYANKLVTTGEGGMVLTNDAVAAERARSYRNLCFNKNERFLHDDIGYNFRMTAIQAAVGLGQLERIDEIVERKRKIGQLYVSLLKKIPGLKLQIEKDWAKTVYWMYALELPESMGITAKEAMAALGKRGIGTRPFFRGLHDQPNLKLQGVLSTTESFPVTDAAYKYGFYLPSGMALTEDQVHEVCSTFAEVLQSLDKRTNLRANHARDFSI